MSRDEPFPEHVLIDRVRAGDREAFERVFRAHHATLVRFARAQLRDRTASEDVVHDVFLRLWRSRADLRIDRSLRAYLVAAVRHRVIDVVRSRGSEQRTLEFRGGPADLSLLERPARPVADPAEVSQLDEAIREAVADLPERCRTAFLLCREEDMTYAEAAAAMDVSPSTVKTQMARALAALRSALEPFLLLTAMATLPTL